MDAFVRRLIERLHHPSEPLSRNRHFHTFETPEGKKALKTSRELKSLQRDLVACAKEGKAPTIRQTGKQVEIRIERKNGRRTALLTKDEYELLLQLKISPLPGGPTC